MPCVGGEFRGPSDTKLGVTSPNPRISERKMVRATRFERDFCRRRNGKAEYILGVIVS